MPAVDAAADAHMMYAKEPSNSSYASSRHPQNDSTSVVSNSMNSTSTPATSRSRPPMRRSSLSAPAPPQKDRRTQLAERRERALSNSQDSSVSNQTQATSRQDSLKSSDSRVRNGSPHPNPPNRRGSVQSGGSLMTQGSHVSAAPASHHPSRSSSQAHSSSHSSQAHSSAHASQYSSHASNSYQEVPHTISVTHSQAHSHLSKASASSRQNQSSSRQNSAYGSSFNHRHSTSKRDLKEVQGDHFGEENDSDDQLEDDFDDIPTISRDANAVFRTNKDGETTLMSYSDLQRLKVRSSGRDLETLSAILSNVDEGSMVSVDNTFISNLDGSLVSENFYHANHRPSVSTSVAEDAQEHHAPLEKNIIQARNDVMDE
jgi:hypothetical protein